MMIPFNREKWCFVFWRDENARKAVRDKVYYLLAFYAKV
jgi:hypothetical protein